MPHTCLVKNAKFDKLYLGVPINQLQSRSATKDYPV